MTGSNAIAAVRLTTDAWRHDDVADLQRLKRILDELGAGELRSTAEDLARLVASLGAVLEEREPEFVFDDWIADMALAGAAGETTA